MTDTPHLIKQVFRRAFNEAAHHYDEAAVLQNEVGQRLMERLDYIRLQPQSFVDIGSGTSATTLQLSQRYRKATGIHFDLAHNMLVAGRAKSGWLQRRRLGTQWYVCGDAEQLPLADQSVDLIFSNLAIQWCNNVDKAFSEFKRILRPNGTLLFSTMGPDTLKELRDSWSQVDQRTHVHRFMDMHDIGDALLRNGFADPVMDMEHITLTYEEAKTLMRDLKSIGAHNAAPGRNKGLQGKSGFKKMLQHYETYRHEGRLPATYEIVYGNAWCAQDHSPSVTVNFNKKS